MVLADVFTATLPLTQRNLWQGLFGDVQSAKPSIYEVLVDESRRIIITDGPEDPQTYWRAEEAAFRKKYQERILGLVAEREKSSPNDLRIDNGILRHYPLAGRMVWLGKISGVKAQVGVDTQKIELVEIKALEEAEAKARSDKYGKLHRDLFYFLQAKPPEQKVKVLLWGSGVDEEWVGQELARLYPQIRAYRFSSGTPVDQRGSPIQIDETLFDKVRADYNRLLTQAEHQATASVQKFLETRGYSFRVADAVPCVEAELPISVILELNRAALPGLAAVYFGDIQVRPQLDSVARTIRATQVWNAGYTGQGVRVAIMENGGLATNITHRALQGKVVASNFNGVSAYHPGAVAGVIAGNHPNFPQWRGVAYGSSLVGASTDGGFLNALNYAVDQQAFVINASFATTATLVMQAEDRMFDYIVRLRDPSLVVGSGNMLGDNWNIRSPGKAYNVITVGGFDDINGSGSPYTMWWGSAWINPYIDGQSGSGDREKPEVVAVGVNVTTADVTSGDDAFAITSGTSVATPQVSALAALLIHRYFWLRTNPEAVKAIIMASATTNIEGAARLSDKDGAGGIDVSRALSIFEKGGWGYKIIHNIFDSNDPTNPFRGSGSSYDYTGSDFAIGNTYARAGELVRAVICWDSNPAADYSTDPLSTDFDLNIISPSGTLSASSVMFDNNYEIVQFTATETGYYKMRVKYYAVGYPDERFDLGLGLAWLRVTDKVYLPLILR